MILNAATKSVSHRSQILSDPVHTSFLTTDANLSNWNKSHNANTNRKPPNHLDDEEDFSILLSHFPPGLEEDLLKVLRQHKGEHNSVHCDPNDLKTRLVMRTKQQKKHTTEKEWPRWRKTLRHMQNHPRRLRTYQSHPWLQTLLWAPTPLSATPITTLPPIHTPRNPKHKMTPNKKKNKKRTKSTKPNHNQLVSNKNYNTPTTRRSLASKKTHTKRLELPSRPQVKRKERKREQSTTTKNENRVTVLCTQGYFFGVRRSLGAVSPIKARKHC